MKREDVREALKNLSFGEDNTITNLKEIEDLLIDKHVNTVTGIKNTYTQEIEQLQNTLNGEKQELEKTLKGDSEKNMSELNEMKNMLEQMNLKLEATSKEAEAAKREAKESALFSQFNVKDTDVLQLLIKDKPIEEVETYLTDLQTNKPYLFNSEDETVNEKTSVIKKVTDKDTDKWGDILAGTELGQYDIK